MPDLRRADGRRPDELRPVTLQRSFTRVAPGSVLVRAGGTAVLCTVDVEEGTPPWLAQSGRGWLTAEYNMLPSSTRPRKRREREGKLDGRTTEIQRLVGRSLRAAIDLEALGPRTVTIDCDVLEADGGTRTASITGAFVALVDALAPLAAPPNRPLLVESVAAVSVGLVDGRPLLDLDYAEDVRAAVDMNVVMTGSGRFIELQGTGEQATFSHGELEALVELGRRGVGELVLRQQSALGERWPWPR